jgi:6-pyruvoyl-tetrahydropterin synthase related domain
LTAANCACSWREWRKTRAIRYSLTVHCDNELLDRAILNGTKTIHASVITEPTSQPASRASADSSRLALLLVAVAATAVIAPMFFLGNASGHDFQFHLASWLDVAGQWREGIFFARWAEWANWGYGEPRFVFYPPGSWMLGATLGSLLPWRMAPGAFIWLALLLAGYSMWRFAREWLSPRETAAAAVLYAVNPYHLIIVYYRSDFAELLANALLPLALCGMVRLLREGWRSLQFLAVPFALIWLANAPAAVLATYSLMLLFSVASILRRSLRPLILGGVSMAVGFGLAAFYILPAAYEQRWVQIHQALADLLSPDQNFLFTHAIDPEFLFFNWKVSGVAMGVMLITGIAAVIVARRRREFPEIWWMLLTLGAAATLLMFPPSLFLWRMLPKLEFVQFPWRWLGVLDVVFAFFLAAAIGRAKRPWIAGLAIGMTLTMLAAALVYDGWWDSEDIPVLTKAIQAGRGYEGTDEYQPLGSDRYELPGSDPGGEIIGKPAPRIQEFVVETSRFRPAPDGTVRIERWTADEKRFTSESATPVTIALRLLNYPGWRVQVDGISAQPGAAPETAQMLIALPAGAHQVEVQFTSTWDRIAGAIISAIFAILLAAYMFFTRTPRKKVWP